MRWGRGRWGRARWVCSCWGVWRHWPWVIRRLGKVVGLVQEMHECKEGHSMAACSRPAAKDESVASTQSAASASGHAPQLLGGWVMTHETVQSGCWLSELVPCVAGWQDARAELVGSSSMD